MIDNVKNIPTSVDVAVTGGVDTNSNAKLFLTDTAGRMQITGGASNLPTVDAADGATNTTAPVFATQVGAQDGTGKLQALLVDNSGNLKVTSTGGAAGTQYADGTTQATPTGTAALGKNASNVLHTLSLDNSGNLNVNLAAGTISGGNAAASATGSAVPASADYLGAKDGSGNLQGLLVESNTNPNLRVSIYNGANEASVSAGGAVKVDGSAVTQPISGSVGLNTGTNTIGSVKLTDGTNTATVTATGAQKVDGSAVTQPVSGTVTANQGTAAASTAGWPVIGGNLAETTAAWTSATAGNTALQLNVAGYNSVAVTLNQGSTITGGVVTFEVSDTTAFTNAYPVTAVQASSFTYGITYTLQQSTNQAFEIDVGGFAAFRVRLSTVITGTGTVNVGIAANAMAADPSVVVGGTVTSTQGTAAALAGAWPVKVTDGTNTMPTGDAAARTIHTTIDNSTIAVTESGTWNVGSSTATGSAVPANAFFEGGIAKTALPTAATDGNLTGTMVDKFGRQVCLLGSIRDLTGTQTTTISASTTETTIVTAGGAGVFNDLVMLIVSNTSASTNTRIDFRDTTAGTVLFSLFSVGGAAPVGFALPIPIPQTTANTNWTATCATSTTDVRIYAVFVKNK